MQQSWQRFLHVQVWGKNTKQDIRTFVFGLAGLKHYKLQMEYAQTTVVSK